MALPAGSKLGPYEIGSLLGAGGMGEVYRARDPRLARDVAIKVLPSSSSEDPDRRRRFEQEARVVGALNHPNLLAVYDIGQHDGHTYVVFELLEGTTLRDRLRSGALPVKKAVDFASQIARGLSAAHEKSIIHRDLKPANLFVTKDGRVKILDFGLAKLRPQLDRDIGADAATASAVTDAGTVLGTVGYMSPEQVKARPVDHRSDIFSFGAVLYEMLSGKQAFRRDSAVETMNAILKEDPPKLSRTDSNVPPALERILSRCLEKDPDARFRSAHDLAFALDSASGVPDAGSGASSAPAKLDRTGAWRTKYRWLIAVALAAVAYRAVVVGLGLRTRGGNATTSHRATTAAIQVEKLTNRGNASGATISPDGRYLAYSCWDGNRATCWLRDLTEKTETRLLPPGEGEYSITRFAKDGQSIYYWFQPKGSSEGATYRVPLIGGDPRLIPDGIPSPDQKHLAVTKGLDPQHLILSIAGTEGEPTKEIGEIYRESLSWSPDSSGLLFFREIEKKYALFFVRADGSAERKVLDLGERPVDVAWRPRGGGVVLATYKDEYESARFYDLDVTTGVTRPLGDRLFRLSGEWDWLPDGSALIINAKEGRERGGLFVVSYPDGRAERIPADGHSYGGFSLTSDGSKLVSVQGTERSDIVVSSDIEQGSFKKIASGTDVVYRPCWTVDGKLVYSSNDTGSYDLYVSDADGSNRKPLTSDRESDETQPSASPDGRYIVFVSDRTGEQGIYRINRDGTDLKSLTPKPTPHYRDYGPQVTPDGRWVLYNHWYYGPSVWKVPIDGGTPVLVKGGAMRGNGVGDEWATGASASPDGKSLAFFYCSQNPDLSFSGTRVVVASPNGQIVQRFASLVPRPEFGDDWRVQWSRDGKALYYGSIREPNLWKQPLSGGPPVQLTHFEEEMRSFDWSFDGKTLAVSRMSRLRDVVLITNFH